MTSIVFVMVPHQALKSSALTSQSTDTICEQKQYHSSNFKLYSNKNIKNVLLLREKMLILHMLVHTKQILKTQNTFVFYE